MSTYCISQTHLRQYPLIDKILDGRHYIAESFMNSFGILEDKILGKFFIEELFIRKKMYMMANELLLDGSVVPFNVGIDLRTPGIKDTVLLEVFMEIPEVL